MIASDLGERRHGDWFFSSGLYLLALSLQRLSEIYVFLNIWTAVALKKCGNLGVVFDMK